jgi:type II secretory pathway component PulM
VIENAVDKLDKLQVTWNNLTNREKRITAALGLTLAAFLLGLPLYMIASGNAELEQENTALRELLGNIAQRRDRLVQIADEKRQAERRYQQKAPPLGSFLEALARDQGLTIQEVTDQPQKKEGKFTRRNVRVKIPNVALTPLVNLMSAIETSRYPVAIEQIQLEHFQTGDTYNARIGVVTYDKEGAGSTAKEESEGSPRRKAKVSDSEEAE